MKENDEIIINKTLESFLEQFGSYDTYTKIVLEEFFREILDAKSDLHISCEKRQKGN